MKPKDIYRPQSRRLKHWDYASPGSYFITICTHKKTPYLGSIVQGELHLSSMGIIVVQEWSKTASLRPYVALDAYVVMPNHLHGILAFRGTQTKLSRHHHRLIQSRMHTPHSPGPRQRICLAAPVL